MNKPINPISVIFLIALSMLLYYSCGDDEKPVTPGNHAPVISSLEAEPDTFIANHTALIFVTAEDADGDELTYKWETSAQWLVPASGSGNIVEVINCCEITEFDSTYVRSIVEDGRGGVARDSIKIWVLPEG